MSNSLAYQRMPPANPPQWWPAGLAVATFLVIGACCAWARTTPSLGERALPGVKIWSARCAAVSFWMGGHAVLFAVVLPALYRTRPVYAGVAAVASLVAALAGISAVALWLAS